MKIGVLIYGSLNTISGGYLYDRKLVEYLRAEGDQVEIISLPWRNYAAHLSDNFHFRLPPGLDILIQDELNHPSLIAANLQPHPYPVVSLVHHLRCSELRPRWQNRFYRFIEKWYLEHVDGFIFNSQTTQTVATKLIGEKKPMIVAYPPTDRFGAALSPDFVSARAAEAGPLRIIFVGNLIFRKGLHILLDAIAHSELDVRLDVIGSTSVDSVYATAMQNKVRNAGLDGKVFFQGIVDNEFLADKLRSAQVMAVPSSYEGFGITYLEGMAFGLPAIGTTAGAAFEIISDGVNGYLIEPESATMLAACLKALAHERPLLERMSKAALQRYQQQPSWEQTAANIRKFLQSF